MTVPVAATAGTPRVVRVDRLELAFVPRAWDFADERRGEIDAYFAALRRERPQIWNGRVLLLYRFALDGGVFRGSYLETDFASLIAWRDWDFPDRSMRNCFGMGALRGSDGAFVLGRMNAHTANAGLIYFPCGTPDPDDVVAGRVDLERSVRRELAEETGLADADVCRAPGWYTVFAGARIAQIKLLQAAAPAEALRARILAHLAREPQPELADICIARSRADLDPCMPSHVTAFLDYIWAEEARPAARPAVHQEPRP